MTALAQCTQNIPVVSKRMADFVIITYNSNNFCNQSGNDSLGRIVDLVRVVRPHVVCLQVCDQSLVLEMAAIKL